MEEKFFLAFSNAQTQAEKLGVRVRPVSEMRDAHRCLSGHRVSDGFWSLAAHKRLDLTLEALAVKKQYTALFSDEEANNALNRLMDAGYTFQ